MIDLTALEAALVVEGADVETILEEALVAADGDEAAIEAILTTAAEAGVDPVSILAAAVAAGIDPGVVAQIIANTATAAGPTAPGAAPGAGPAAGPASSLPPPPPGFGGGGGGGGGTISGN
ncbi:hypothetical protein ACO1PK_13410 [Alishewanella sp. d11]|uniref:hypothetical protein n=1 Tax=Alishewanella sp. d11 TaxID=3414030 RepID=UPI003BF90AA4